MTAHLNGEQDLAMDEPRRPIGSGPLSKLAIGHASAEGAEQFSVVVMGGGPAGLAAGCELAQRGIDFVILESGSRLGENWRPRWDSLRVFTSARFDGLPGLPLHGDEGRCLTKDEMSVYLEQYAQRFGLPVRFGIHVPGLILNERGQVLVEWEHSRLVADQVIVATELETAQRRTTVRHDRDRPMIQLRAGEYRTLSQLAQADGLVVVGAGATKSVGSSTRPVPVRGRLEVGGSSKEPRGSSGLPPA
jgi:cation diffusion facilitator CzcD-associated flavoprotein CzcO